MMDGVTIIGYSHSTEVHICISICVGLFVISFILGIYRHITDKDYIDIIQMSFINFLISTCMCVIIIYAGIIHSQDDYIVHIDNEVPFVEFNIRYKLVSQNNNEYIIRKRKPNTLIILLNARDEKLNLIKSTDDFIYLRMYYFEYKNICKQLTINGYEQTPKQLYEILGDKNEISFARK